MPFSRPICQPIPIFVDNSTRHNDNVVSMIPPFNIDGNLPEGIHTASASEIVQSFGGTAHRDWLLEGLFAALRELKSAGCRKVYVDGSFVTEKEIPGDFDGCWDVAGVDPTRLDPVLLTFGSGRAAQKAKYHGELFPAQTVEGASGNTFLEFFQVDRDSGVRKGIIEISLEKEEL
jgi:hypothetical protein